MSSHNLLDQIIAQTKISKKTTDKQQRIVETAIKMFAEKGYANTSTSEIAKESGVAEGTIFRHYGTKDNLLLAVILPFLKDFILVQMEEALSEINPNNYEHFEDFLRAMLRNRLQFLDDNREVFQIMVKELLYREDFRNEMAAFFNSEILTKVTQCVAYFKARGQLADLPVTVIIRMFYSLISGYAISRFIVMPSDAGIDNDAEADQLVQFIMNGLHAPAPS